MKVNSSKSKENQELTQRPPSAQRTQRGRRKGINTEAAERTEDTERKKKRINTEVAERTEDTERKKKGNAEIPGLRQGRC